MNCNQCAKPTKVIETRGNRRRRECLHCGYRFTTHEELGIDKASTATKTESSGRNYHFII